MTVAGRTWWPRQGRSPTAWIRLAVVILTVLSFVPLFAQDCPCPPAPTPGWHGNGGAGLAITDGNSDTQTYNLSLLLTYDPQKRHVVKIDGLYLRSRAEGEDTADKSALGVRDEYKLGRAFLFGEGRHQRDRFKQLGGVDGTRCRPSVADASSDGR